SPKYGADIVDSLGSDSEEDRDQAARYACTHPVFIMPCRSFTDCVERSIAGSCATVTFTRRLPERDRRRTYAGAAASESASGATTAPRGPTKEAFASASPACEWACSAPKPAEMRCAVS